MSENERRGFLVLTLLIGVLALVPWAYRVLCTEKKGKGELVSLTTVVLQQLKSMESDPAAKQKSSSPAVAYFRFDPNNLSAEKWAMLGFKDHQIQVIKNYEAKGGRFRVKRDLAKIYVVSEADYNRIERYIDLPDFLSAKEQNVVFSAEKVLKSSKKETLIDLSTADTTTLKKIGGIGSVLAARIVKFRDALGGFHALEQISEVYGVSEEQFIKMLPVLTLSDPLIRKLKINECTVEQLARHPYISHKQAMHIVRYREQNGSFVNLADLRELVSLSDDFFLKAAPYLDFHLPSGVDVPTVE